MGGSDAAREDGALQAYYAATLAHVAAQRAKGGGVGERYAAVEMPAAA